MFKDKPRLFILGSHGFLGGYAVNAATAAGFVVIGGNRTHSERDQSIAVDITDSGSVNAAFRVARPDFVLLLAAMSDIDKCQKFPERANAVNLRGAEHVAEACMLHGSRMLFTSSGAVFDGKKHGYREGDPVSPVSVYGETKAMAEQAISLRCPSAIVVRLALVLGFAARPGTNAWLDSLKLRWASGETTPMPTFEQRNPIDAPTVARLMVDLLVMQGIRGILHLGCDDPITRYDLALKIASRMGFPEKVVPQFEPAHGRAPRGADQYLLTTRLREVYDVGSLSCDQVIERCFNASA